MSTIENQLSKIKINVVAAFNLGYRVIDGTCYDGYGEKVKCGINIKRTKYSEISYLRFYINKKLYN